MTESRSLLSLFQKWESAVTGTNNLQPPHFAHLLQEDGADRGVSNIVEHTGDVIDGSIFVARVRTGTDGHPYIPQAIDKGATVIIGQRPLADLDQPIPSDVLYFETTDSAESTAWLAAAWHDFPGQHLRIIGLTGTNGKTTTGAILFGILQQAGIKCGLITTIRAVFGDVEEPTGLHVTTPAAPQLQGYLRRMVDSGLTHCIIETTSHGLAQHRVTAVPYEFGVLTNITHEHIDYHGSYAEYVAAKKRLFEIASQHPNGHLVLNSDDPVYAEFSQIEAPKQVSFGQFLKPDGNRPDVTGSDVQFSAKNTQFQLSLLPRTHSSPIFTELLGQFNVSNILCAAAVAQALGVTIDQIKDGVAAVKAVSGRMERIDEGQPFLTIVDFAHTPDALDKAIESAKNMLQKDSSTRGKIITVFGSAGKRDIEKRRLMAETSAQKADITILTAEDPRTEPLEGILEMMASGCVSQGGVEGETFWRVPDRGQAIYLAATLAQPADILLICGKGHEQSMCFGIQEFPWDDRHATRLALQAYLQKKPMPSLGLPTENPLF